jgi:hypothetical protein
MLLLLSFRRIGQIDPGFETRHLLVLACDLETDGLAESRGRQTYERLIEEVRRLPGVKAAALSENLIFRPARLVRRVTVDGADRPELADGLAMPTSSVSPGYFETLGSPLLSGRGFGHEQPGERRAAVVNQTFARMAWNTGDPLGRTLRLDGEAAPLTVIGVVRDARYESLTEAPAPHVFLSLNQFFSPSAALYVRTEGPINREIRDVAAPLARVVPEVSVTSIETARGLIEDSLWATRAGTCLLGGFAAVSLVLALLGIYCLTRRTVQQRRHEIGVRLALGADQRKVFWMIVGHSLRVTALGILIGAMAAIGCARALAGFLQDPALFGAIPLVLTGAALLTTAFVGGALPARTVMTFELREIFGMGG